jgi:light-regulated signal transduction histidine kinase (bacteriophytochrome)
LLYPLFFFRGVVRLSAVFVISADDCLLLLLERRHPSWITPYHSASDRLLDLATGFSFSAIFCAVIFLIVVTAFERELEERKNAEASLLSLNLELDLRVRERTARLQAALKEQESFSYSVSHDLRAHLRHINSYLSIICEDFGEALPTEATSLLVRSRTASRRMGDLIDDLLALSKVSRADLNRGIVDLSELADWVCKRFSELEPGRNVEVVVAPDQRAVGDKTLLLQMMENLLGNAWKYTSATAAATIAFGSMELDSRQVFYVSDNGAGFDMTYREALFEPFRRLHGAEFEGNGVGLTTVKRIIERHGGEVWAEGAVENGATFFFTLPAT